MRNGIQDYEYFWLLENKIRNLKDSLGSRFDWIDPKQRGKEIAGEVVKDLLVHSYDPDVLYGARIDIIQELLDFETSPQIYIQTNPPIKSSPVKERSYLVEVFGWAEKGTGIRINGEQVRPDNQGLFLWNLKVSKEENNVTIEARKDGSAKTVIREFEVER